MPRGSRSSRAWHLWQSGTRRARRPRRRTSRLVRLSPQPLHWRRFSAHPSATRRRWLQGNCTAPLRRSRKLRDVCANARTTSGPHNAMPSTAVPLSVWLTRCEGVLRRALAQPAGAPGERLELELRCSQRWPAESLDAVTACIPFDCDVSFPPAVSGVGFRDADDRRCVHHKGSRTVYWERKRCLSVADMRFARLALSSEQPCPAPYCVDQFSRRRVRRRWSTTQSGTPFRLDVTLCETDGCAPQMTIELEYIGRDLRADFDEVLRMCLRFTCAMYAVQHKRNAFLGPTLPLLRDALPFKVKPLRPPPVSLTREALASLRGAMLSAKLDGLQATLVTRNSHYEVPEAWLRLDRSCETYRLVCYACRPCILFGEYMPCSRRFVAFDAAELSGERVAGLPLSERLERLRAEPAPRLWPLRVEHKEFLRDRLPQEASDADGVMVHGADQDYKWKAMHTIDLKCDVKGKLRARGSDAVWGTAPAGTDPGVWECTAEKKPQLVRRRFDKPLANPNQVCCEIMNAQEQGILREELLQVARC